MSARRTMPGRAAGWLLAALAAVGPWASRSAAAEDLTVSLEQFGALRAFRPGDSTGLCVSLRSNRAEPLECVVQWDLPNADGDLVSHARPVTLTPGQPTRRWLYARLPPAPSALRLASEPLAVRVFETRDGARVRELASVRFKASDAARPSEPIDMTSGLVAILGDDRMGLETLDAEFGGPQVPSMSERTRVLPGSRVADLPDRWEGLASAEAIVWAGGSPGMLDPERGDALLEWIDRGGHLVIVLPEAGDPWSLRGSGSHPLAGVLPSRGVLRAEGLDVESLLEVLSKGRDLRQAGVTTAATLFDPAKLDRGWKPLMMLPAAASSRDLAGTALAVQRTLGHGRVTLVGLDLPVIHGRALSPDGLPQADVFWNRVLGRRADSPTLANYNQWQAAKPTQLVGNSRQDPYPAGDASLVRKFIGEEVQATGGVLALLAFFTAYWMLAVPGAWWTLKRRGRLAAAWPTFALAAVVAAPIAWSLGFAFGGARVQVRHLSVADWVMPSADDGEGARVRRLRVNAWMGVALGGFGTTPVSLGDTDQRTDLLLDWSPPPDGNASRFPDTAQATRAVDQPSEIRAPSRATASDMQAWSLCRPPQAWGRVSWIEEGRPIEVVCTSGASPTVSLRGSIRHGLPGTLRDVTISHVTPWLYETRSWSGGTNPAIRPSGLPPRPTRMATLGAWSGEALDLGATLYPQGPLPVSGLGPGSMVSEMASLYTRPLEGELATALGGAFGKSTEIRKLGMLGMFQMLEPPAYRKNPPTDPPVVRFERLLGRDIDLSVWFTRPCVVITGFLDDAPLPAPVRIDGREATSLGTVLVRMVLPLPCEDRGFVRLSP